MKNFFEKIFEDTPHKDKEQQDDYLNNLIDNFFFSHEFIFQHENEKIQLRASPNKKVTLGMLLNRTFDVNQNEVSDMFVISDSLRHEKEEKLITDQNDIWNFDLCSAILYKEDEDIQYRFTENVILVISYRKNYIRKDDKDKSLHNRCNNIIIHLRGIGGGKNSWYILASIMIPEYNLELRTYTTRNIQAQTLSVVFAYDETSPEERIAKYNEIRDEAIQKANNGEDLDLFQGCIIAQMTTMIGHDFYWGNKVLEEHRLGDAIVYFENVYT